MLLPAIRVALATIAILATVFWGFVITFSDPPPQWSTTRWILDIVAWHLPGAFIVGLLLPRTWWIGLLAGGSAGLMLIGSGLLAGALLLFGAIAAAAFAGARITRFVSRAVLVTLVASYSFACFPYIRSDDVWKHPAYQGVVFDARTEQPISGATVVWVEGRKSVVTDDSGRFTLPGVHGPPVGLTGFSDQMENRTTLITHPRYRDYRFAVRQVLYVRPVKHIGEIYLTPRD